MRGQFKRDHFVNHFTKETDEYAKEFGDKFFA